MAARECFRMPAPGWRVMSSGSTYSDKLGPYGPVKSALVPGYTSLKFGSVNRSVYCGSTEGGSVRAPRSPTR
jgi:hypothetical protein